MICFQNLSYVTYINSGVSSIQRLMYDAKIRKNNPLYNVCVESKFEKCGGRRSSYCVKILMGVHTER